MPDMQELVHSCRVVLPSGRIEEMFFVRPSDAEKLLRKIERLLLLFAEITALQIDSSGKHGLRLHEAIAFCKANAAEAKGGE